MNTVYLPFVRAAESVDVDYLPHCSSAENARRIAQRAAQNRHDFGYDKVQYRGQVAGRPQYGPRLARWCSDRPGAGVWTLRPLINARYPRR